MWGQEAPQYGHLWTQVFSDEEWLIREDVEFIFIRGVLDRKEKRLRPWLIDHVGEPRLLSSSETR